MRIGERRTAPEIPGHGVRERSGKAAGQAGDSVGGAPGGCIDHLPAMPGAGEDAGSGRPLPGPRRTAT